MNIKRILFFSLLGSVLVIALAMAQEPEISVTVGEPILTEEVTVDPYRSWVRVTPTVILAPPYTVRLQGSVDESTEANWCQAYVLEWGDGSVSKAVPDCRPFDEAKGAGLIGRGRRSIPPLHHTYRSSGVMRLRFKTVTNIGTSSEQTTFAYAQEIRVGVIDDDDPWQQ